MPTPAPEADPPGSTSPAHLDRWFTPLVAVLSLAYLGIQLLYVQRIPLSMDELQGAYTVQELERRVPYAQFAPYKTVLGYYLQLPLLRLSDDTWQRLLWVKRGMAILNTGALFLVARSLGRQFSRDAVLLSFVALLSMSTFLERSSELRVDGMTAMAGLLSFAWLLERRFVAAGIAAGVSFLVSQKGAYYCAAGFVALASYFWALDRHRPALGALTRFGLSAALVFGAYLALWSAAASPLAVAAATVGAAARTAIEDPYATLWKYWRQTIERGPYFYAAAMLGIGLAFGAALRSGRYRDWVTWTFAGSVVALCLWHRQPWPYFFVLLIPFLWIPLAFFFEALPRRGVLFWLLYLGVGLAYPLARVPEVLAFDQTHQRHAVALAERLLDPDERYLAGVNAILTRQQAPAELTWLDKAGIARLKGAKGRQALEDLRAEPPKLVLWNYRLAALPFAIRRHLLTNYERLSGVVRIYAPYVEQRRFRIAYDGKYRLVAGTPIVIDDHKVLPNETVRLRHGPHRANRAAFRLVWAPPRARFGKPLEAPYAERELFEAVYAY